MDWLDSLMGNNQQSNGYSPMGSYKPLIPSDFIKQQASANSSLINAPGNPGASDMSWGSPGMGQAIGLGIGGLQAINGGMQAYLGMKNYGLAKDTLASNKQQYWNNFTSQARLTNAELRDRQAMRVANDPGSQSVDSYMKQNSINPEGYR